MFADLPPAAKYTFFTVPAACCMTCLPTRVEPVNMMMSTGRASVMPIASAGSLEVTTLTTPCRDVGLLGDQAAEQRVETRRESRELADDHGVPRARAG